MQQQPGDWLNSSGPFLSRKRGKYKRMLKPTTLSLFRIKYSSQLANWCMPQEQQRSQRRRYRLCNVHTLEVFVNRTESQVYKEEKLLYPSQRHPKWKLLRTHRSSWSEHGSWTRSLREQQTCMKLPVKLLYSCKKACLEFNRRLRTLRLIQLQRRSLLSAQGGLPLVACNPHWPCRR